MASPVNQPDFDLRTIYNELSVVKYKWFDIGLQMGIPYHKLKEFKLEEQDPLAAIIDYGLKENMESPFSWKSIVEALSSENKNLTKRLEYKYCQEEGAVKTDTSSSYQESLAATFNTSSGSSSFKLPAINMARYFPHLKKDDKDKMSDELLSVFRAELDDQTSKIKQAFASLVFDLQRNIEEKHKVEDLINILKFLDDRKFVQKISKCSSVAQVFENLSPFFDYKIIKFLTTKLGSDFNKDKLKKYRVMFKKFAEQRVCQCPSDAFDEVGKPEKVFVLKTDRHMKDLTIEEAKILTRKLCEVLKLQLKLLRIEEGCVKLSFRAYNIKDITISEEQEQLCSQLGSLSLETLEDLDDVPSEQLHESAQPTNIASSADLHTIIQSGNVDVLKRAIQIGEYNPLDKDIFNFNALHTATKFGRLEMLSYLVEDLMCNPSLPGNQGETPLHIAAKFGQLKVIEYLISKQSVDPYIKDHTGCLPAHHACLSNQLETLKYLITAMCEYTDLKDVLGDFTEDGLALIHLAALGGHHEVLKYLIQERNCDPCLLTTNGCTPIYKASEKGHLSIVKYLVESRRCDPSAANHSNTTPLHVAARNGHLAVVQYLTKHGCNPKLVNKAKVTPLFGAANAGRLEIVKYLIEECHCDPKIEGPLSFDCFHAACDGGHLEVVKYLTEKRHMSIRKCVGKSKTTGLHLATIKGHQLVLEYLSLKDEDLIFLLNDKGLSPIHLAAHHNCVAALVCFVVKHAIDPNIKSSKGVTPLMMAEKNCAQDAVDFLKKRIKSLSKQNVYFLDSLTELHKLILNHSSLSEIKVASQKYSDCDIPNAVGQTPLHNAASFGCLDIVKYFIEKKNCDPKRRDNGEFTALHLAAEGGNLDIVVYLISNQQCDPTTESFFGPDFDQNIFSPAHQKTTPLHAAADNGHLEIVKYLLEKSGYEIDPEVKGLNGWTPLLFSAYYGELHVVKYLVEKHHCDPLHRDTKFNTAIHLAAAFGRLCVLQYFIEDLKCPAGIANKEKDKPIHIAAIQGNLDSLKYFIETIKFDPNSRNGDGLSILHFAAIHGHLEMVKYIVTESLCAVSLQDKNKFQPLHYAAIHGHVDIVKYFAKETNCNLMSKNCAGCVPLHLAAKYGCFEVVEFLTKEMHTPLAVKSRKNFTPLDYALQNNHHKVALYLIVLLFNDCINFNTF